MLWTREVVQAKVLNWLLTAVPDHQIAGEWRSQTHN
jgi:hypothetical protein